MRNSCVEGRKANVLQQFNQYKKCINKPKNHLWSECIEHKKKTKAYANGNPDPSLGQIRSCEGVKPFNLIWTLNADVMKQFKQNTYIETSHLTT